MKTDPNASAHPVHGFFDLTGATVDDPRNGVLRGGLTKREHFAAMAIQGILADGTSESHYADLAVRAVRMADYLIEALNKEEQ